MRMLKKEVFILLILILNIGHALAQNDYLALSGQPRLTHTEKITSGDPYTAELSLVRAGIVPRKATLKISTSVVNPVIKLTIDGSNQTFSASPGVDIDLIETGVNQIDIVLSGNAPTVSTDTAMDFVYVRTYVEYDDMNKGTQDEIKRSIVVTNPDIEDSRRAIENAKDALEEAEDAISLLKSQGIDALSLETRLELERDRIIDAEVSKERGYPIEARKKAENAQTSLEGIIADATAMSERKVDIKKYGSIALAVIIIWLGLTLIRKKREELG